MMRCQDMFRSFGSVTPGRTQTNIFISRTYLCALYGQVASKYVSEHFYLRKTHTFIVRVRCGFVLGVRNAHTSHSLTLVRPSRNPQPSKSNGSFNSM